MPRRIAAGHDDARVGVEPRDAANGLPRALVGARDDEHWAKLRAIRAQLGTILGQTEAWLLMRGMRTLYPRVQWACRSAEQMARKFAEHPMVAEVLYPGLPSFAGHAAASRQMTGGFGGMVTIDVKGGTHRLTFITAASAAKDWMDSLRSQ